MHYTLHQLQVFQKIVHLKSITRAAEELNMTQPAVSIQLRNFQDQFDISLTEVVGRQLYITEFGMEISTLAEKVLNEVSAINYKTQAYKGILAGKLKIASVSTGKYLIPYFLSGFLAQYPGVELILDVTNKNRVVQSLAKNEIDFALVSVLPDDLKVEEELLLENRLYLVGSSREKWGKKNSLKEIAATVPMIFREEGSATRHAMEKFLAKNKISIRKKLELTSNEAVKQSVIAGLGCSIMPLIGIRNELQTGELQIIRIEGMPVRTEWRLIWLSAKRLSPVASAYVSFIRASKKAVVDADFGWAKKFR